MDRQLKQLSAGFYFIHSHDSNTTVYIYAKQKDIKQDVVDLVSSVWFVLLNQTFSYLYKTLILKSHFMHSIGELKFEFIFLGTKMS